VPAVGADENTPVEVLHAGIDASALGAGLSGRNHGSIFSIRRPRQSALYSVNVSSRDIPASATLKAKFERIMPLTFSVSNLVTPALAVSRWEI
jgi:hypothetical protein